jgi:hypothetical protein
LVEVVVPLVGAIVVLSCPGLSCAEEGRKEGKKLESSTVSSWLLAVSDVCRPSYLLLLDWRVGSDSDTDLMAELFKYEPCSTSTARVEVCVVADDS